MVDTLLPQPTMSELVKSPQLARRIGQRPLPKKGALSLNRDPKRLSVRTESDLLHDYSAGNAVVDQA